jgi:hypothetical protein
MTNEKEHPYGDQENQNDADNDYGLPEAEFSPISQQQQAPQPTEEPVYPAYTEPVDSRQQSSTAQVWIALLVVAVLAAAILYFFLKDDFGKEEIAKKPPVEQKKPEPVVKTEPVPEEAWNVEPVEPEKPAVGEVSTLNSRTGRYYTIIGSFIDGDLARDYANKLAAEGVNTTIIEPAGKRKFYRLSVADAASFSELDAKLAEQKAKYGDNVWIVKY